MFTWQPRRFFWGWLAATLLLGLLGAIGGVGSALWFLSLVPFVTSVVALIRHRHTLWFGTATTHGLVLMLVGSLALGAVGMAVGGATMPPSNDLPPAAPQTKSATTWATTTLTPTPTPLPAPTPTPSPTPAVTPQDATPPPPPVTTQAQPAPAPAPVTTQAQPAPAPAPVTTQAQPAPAPAPVTTQAQPAPAPPPAGDQVVEGTITNGAFCKKELAGWYGYTVHQVRERCTWDASANRYRWLPA